MGSSDIYKQALERLSIPLSFDVPTRASPEGHARMVYAGEILKGATLEQAEEAAEAAAVAARNWLVQRSLRES